MRDEPQQIADALDALTAILERIAAMTTEERRDVIERFDADLEDESRD